MEIHLVNYPSQLLSIKELKNNFNEDINDIDEFCGPYSNLDFENEFSTSSNSPIMELAPPSNVSTLPSEDDCVSLDDAIDAFIDIDVHHKEKRIDVKDRLHKKISADEVILPPECKEFANNVEKLTSEEKEKREVKKERNRKAAKKSRDKKKEEYDNVKQKNKELTTKKEVLEKEIADIRLKEAWFECILSDMNPSSLLRGHLFKTAEPLNKDDLAVVDNIISWLSAHLDYHNLTENVFKVNGCMELSASSPDSSQDHEVMDQFHTAVNLKSPNNVPIHLPLTAQEQQSAVVKMSELVMSSSQYSATSGAPVQTIVKANLGKKLNVYYPDKFYSKNSFYSTDEIFSSISNEIVQSPANINYDSNQLNENNLDIYLPPAVKKARLE